MPNVVLDEYGLVLFFCLGTGSVDVFPNLPILEVLIVICSLRFLNVPGDLFVESVCIVVLRVRDFYSVVWYVSCVVVVPVVVF